jgi:hypothetical protein
MVNTVQFFISITTLSPIQKEQIIKGLKKEFPQSFIKMWVIMEQMEV